MYIVMNMSHCLHSIVSNLLHVPLIALIINLLYSRGVCAKSVGLSGDLLTAALSNATLVVWKLNQETPIGYFAFSQGIKFQFLHTN